jgi:hypothetical protein
MICYHYLRKEATQQMAITPNKTISDIMVQTTLEVLAIQDVDLKVDDNPFIDLTLELDLVNQWLDVSFDEWRLGCRQTILYLQEHRDILAYYANLLIQGTSINETFCSKVMLLVFQVIYYYRLGEEVYESLQVILDEVLLPRIQQLARQVANVMPLLWVV